MNHDHGHDLSHGLADCSSGTGRSAYDKGMNDRVDLAQIKPLLDLGMIISAMMVVVVQILARLTNDNQYLLPIWIVIPVALSLLIVWRWVPSAPDARPLPSIAFLLGCCLLTALEGTGTSVMMLFLALVNVLVVVGPKLGSLVALGVMAVFFVMIPLWPGRTWGDALRQSIAIVPLLFFVLVMGWALRSLHRSAEANRRLATQLQRSSEDLRELLLTEERNRAARELHDGMGHQLTVVGMGLDLALRTRSADPERAWGEVERAKVVNADALQDMRSWVRAMRPASLQGVRGTAALATVADTFRHGDLKVDLDVQGEEAPLEERVELTFYRVLQEALTNVVRHADATSVQVTVRFETTQVTLVVEDDGNGPPDGSATFGFGLASLTDRVRELDGQLIIDRGRQGGFRLTAELPVGDLTGVPTSPGMMLR